MINLMFKYFSDKISKENALSGLQVTLLKYPRGCELMKSSEVLDDLVKELVTSDKSVRSTY